MDKRDKDCRYRKIQEKRKRIYALHENETIKGITIKGNHVTPIFTKNRNYISFEVTQET
jgi:hypothetical protein